METDCDLASGKLISETTVKLDTIKAKKHTSDRVLIDYKGECSSSKLFS